MRVYIRCHAVMLACMFCSAFKEHLEHFPEVRELLRTLYAANYTEAMRLLAGLKVGCLPASKLDRTEASC